MKDKTEIIYFTLGGITAVSILLAYQYMYGRIGRKESLRDKTKNSDWIEGLNQPIPYESKIWKSYSTKELKDSGSLYPLIISAIIPRPIALISSMDSNGLVNCAPFSYFNVLSHDPPIVAIGICINGRTGKKKDSLNNIEDIGQFVVNIMSTWYVESANHTCGNFDPDINEMDIAGLTPMPSMIVRPPRVGESAIQLECEVVELKPIYNENNQHTVTIVFGKILKFHLLEEVLVSNSTSSHNKPVVDWRKLLPVGRLGGDIYTFVNNGLDLPRPDRKI